MKSIRAQCPLPCWRALAWLAALLPALLLRGATNSPTPPFILLQPQSLAIAEVEHARFEVVADGSVPLSYQWQTVRTNTVTTTNLVAGSNVVTTTNIVAITNIDGATKSAYTLYAANTASAGGFRVVITNQAGAVTSVVASLAVWTVSPRQLLAASITNHPAGGFVLPIQFYPLGDERLISASLAFDPDVVLEPRIARNPALTNVVMAADESQLPQGRLGLEFLVPAGIEAGATALTVADLLDLPSLADKLKNRSDGVSSFVYDTVSDATRTALSVYQGAASDPAPLHNTLVPDLNTIIAGPSIYDEGRFSDVLLRAETQKLLAEDPQGADLARLNRLLLEDAYPLELARNPNPLAGLSTMADFTFQLAPDRRLSEAAFAWVGEPRPLSVRDATNGVLSINTVIVPAVRARFGPPALSLQSGLYTQWLEVVNPAASDVRGARLWAYDLAKDSLTNRIRLANAAQQGLTFTDGTNEYTIPPYFDAGALPPGGARLLTAEYYVSDRRTLPTPRYELTVNQPTILDPIGTNYIKVARTLFTNDVFFVEFDTLSNYLYYVQYNWTWEDTNSVWKTAVPSVRGNGGRIQWMDTGPPKTERLPPGTTNRYYRVLGP